MAKLKAYSYIRVSSEKQSKGQGVARQRKAAQDYADQHDLELDNLSYQDLGVSAFRGDNAKTGNLRRFIDAVQSGHIPKKSFLLVESLDRISREQPFIALGTFQEIINLGITIVTLADKQVYSQQNLKDQPYQIFGSLMVMIRANEESETKSKRHKANWKVKREKIADAVKMTKTCPHWLKLREDRGIYEIRQDRKKVVEDIFKWSLEGQGIDLISQELNRSKVPCWGRTNGWHASYIQKVLENRAVLGEFVPHIVVDGVRVPQEVREGYYPPIISVELFRAVQAAKQLRKNKGGRKGLAITNLFSGITKCGYCGSPSHVRNRGPKSAKYLQCDRSRRGIGCVKKGFRYDALEESFFEIAYELDLAQILDDGQTRTELAEVELQLVGFKEDRRENKEKSDRLLQVILGSDQPAQAINDKLLELQNALPEIDEHIEALEMEKTKLLSARSRTEESLRETRSLVSSMTLLEPEQLVVTRLRLQQHIKSLVSEVRIYPLGSQPSSEPRIVKMQEELKGYTDSDPDNVKIVERMIANIRATVDTKMTYLIRFHSGRVCIVLFKDKKLSEWEVSWDTAQVSETLGRQEAQEAEDALKLLEAIDAAG